jgi:hypothetical protein
MAAPMMRTPTVYWCCMESPSERDDYERQHECAPVSFEVGGSVRARRWDKRPRALGAPGGSRKAKL